MTDRERLIQILTCCTDTGCNNCPNKKDGHLVCKDYSARIPVHIPYPVAQEVIALLRDQSEIVRCKDCKHAVLTTKGEVKYCQFWQEDEDGNFGGDPLYLDSDFFCAGGERANDD